jgi:hypothetical protein
MSAKSYTEENSKEEVIDNLKEAKPALDPDKLAMLKARAGRCQTNS